jgi:hypothetical protein
VCRDVTCNVSTGTIDFTIHLELLYPLLTLLYSKACDSGN